VLPPEFRPPNADRVLEPIQVYVPAAYPPDLLGPDGHGDHEVDVVARLEPGVSIERARADLTRISLALEKQYPGTNTGFRTSLVPLRDALVANVRLALLVLLGAVGLVWLVSCVNLANLMLVRTASRQREIVMRVALGARRSRIVQALVAHGVVIAALGCAAGVILGFLLKGVLLGLAPAGLPRL